MPLKLPDLPGKPAQQALAGGLLLVALLVLTQYQALSFGFSLVDSPVILMQGILYSPLAYFSSPAAYEFLSPSNLTPWVTLSWEWDYALSGLNPVAFRLHQLAAAVAMLLLVFHLLLRFAVPPAVALLFSWAIAVTPAFLDVAVSLECRHYIEGLVFALLSTLCVLRYRRRYNSLWLLVSALLYALAATAKEIYVPLPGLLFFLLGGEIRGRLVRIIPHAVVAAAYVWWRLHMLRGTFGGYSEAQSYGGVLASAGDLWAVIDNLARRLFGPPAQSLALLAAFGFAAACAWPRLSTNTRIGAAVTAFWVLAPLAVLLPVLGTGYVSERWLFLPVTLLLMFFACLTTVVPGPVRVLASALVLVWTLGASYRQLQEPNRPLVLRGVLADSILAADDALYIDARGPFNMFMASSAPSWIHLSKLHRDRWGTLTLTTPAQQLYHDLEGRTRVNKRLQPLPPVSPFDPGPRAGRDLIRGVDYAADSRSLIFTFDVPDGAAPCVVYLFGPANGLQMQIDSCERWEISTARLSIILRRLGYTGNRANIALWQGEGSALVASRPHRLRRLLADNNIDTRVLLDD